MLEEKAKSLQCTISIENLCVASKCMAWRWDFEWSSSVEEGVGGDLVLRLKRLKGEPKQGWCGVAGKPENPQS